ncbi:seven-hairpin glycosidase [Decorospora gaudefroyi]|uniref:alpha-1,2-Mannosidase n=1 Tax=Decorospora gaudefroyi TaxID=184978 RepID=A0A6A5K6Y5_9PLEO|nr:seven-hairpin glycosidase [Decorospora gaudefroyi]
MSPLIRRIAVLCVSATFVILACQQLRAQNKPLPSPTFTSSNRIVRPVDWKNVPLRYPVSSLAPLPTGTPSAIPKIQHDFGVETEHNKAERLQRQVAVKAAFVHSWNGYKKHAWLQDEVTPVTGGYKNGFGQRGATLVDALDTLIIMDLEDEFEQAVHATNKIDFTTAAVERLNVFETTIRYLGGLLSAYDLSQAKHRTLLQKATELGDMLYAAFDTPNRMPITRWDWENAALNGDQEADPQALSAEIGSLTLEFTRLSQLTGDSKYHDAVQRITDKLEKHQNRTKIPGLFPILVSPLRERFDTDKSFTMGGMSDSLYEYFPKQHLLLGGRTEQYRTLYETAIEPAKKHLFFRPRTPQGQDILISGDARISSGGSVKLEPNGQHLACFAGGMVALGAKIFNRTDELDVARKLVDGCIWVYESMPTGIMPETFRMTPCYGDEDCVWDVEKWHEGVRYSYSGEYDMQQYEVQDIIKENGLQPGFAKIADPRFLLRPEAIESIFILYRITGDAMLQDTAWRMFEAIHNATIAEFAHSAIADVTIPRGQETQKLDECESFWMAETLKYFYLIFSEPSLDRGLVLAKYGHNGKLGLGIALEGAFVNRSRINFDKLKAWLLQCELQHKDMCAVGTARPLSLPLSCIDCRNRSVVPVLESDQYLALSYVWGTNRSSTCRTAQQDMEYLPLNGISQVIEDAISTVISLGKRYLWVDQYCINQLDPRIKEIQIQDMDSVYAGAYATIVACAGSDANYGLPGISRDRDLQPSATFHDFELFSSLPGLGTAVKSTKWATRGWTYQEAVLSHRILFFTDKQVYFVCPNMARSEAEVVHDNAAHDRIRLERMGMSLNSGMFRDGYRSRNRSHLAELDDHIAEFSGRCLTYQGDALDAFRGLLTRSLFFTYYGVPIAPAANTHHSEHPEVFDFAMARGLNWKPTILNTTQGARSTFARRREFPSWSWAGWVGPVDYPSSFFVVPEPEVCDIKFWVEDENKKLSSLFHIASSLQKTRMIPEQSHVLVVDAHLFRVRFKEDVTEDGYMRDYWCYPALTEGEQVESWHPDRDKKASFFENPDRTTELFHRIVSETWDGMVLWTRGRYAHLRILDWVGDVAHVIGHAQLRFRGRGYWKFTGSQRKRIRLV